ncbi:transcriptional regulator [Streptomyces abikoensis]
MVAQIELGNEIPSQRVAQKLDDVLGLNGELVQLWHHVRTTAEQAIYPSWSREGLAAEAEASRIRHFANVVPGLLQTEDYARALLDSGALLFGGDVGDKLSARMNRQAILDGPTPPWFWSILDEAALYRVIGSPAVMRNQLQHLLELAERPRIRIRVLPFKRAIPGGVTSVGAMMLLTRPGKGETVYWESGLNGAFLDHPGEVEVYTTFYDHLELEALPPQASIDLIHNALEEHSRE